MPSCAAFRKTYRSGTVLNPVLRGFGMALVLVALPFGLLAQALVEYALKSGSSVLSHVANSGIAGCKVNSALFACLGRTYPWPAIVVVGVTCLLIAYWLGGITSRKAR